MFTVKNLCIFQGRIARVDDPQTRKGPSGEFSTLKFSMAVDRSLTKEQREKVKNGDQSIRTCDFIPLEASGSTVDFILDWLPKGKAAIVTATYETYETKDKKSGETYYGHKFRVNSIEFITADAKALQDSDNDNNESSNRKKSSSTKRSTKVNNFSMDDDDDEDVDEDDLPFGDDDDEQDW